MQGKKRSHWLSLVLAGTALLGPQALAGRADDPLPQPRPAAAPLRLADLLGMGLAQNPRLRQAELDIDAAGGRAHQAGLYPNPTLTLGGEEIGRRAGIHTLPELSQEIVTGGKLRLSRAVAEQDVDRASLALLRERFELFTRIRQGYYEVLALRRRVEVLDELLKLATQGHEIAKRLQTGKLLAELDVLPFEVERERLGTDLEGARREQLSAWRRLTSSIGVPDLLPVPLAGSLETPLPVYDFDLARAAVLGRHPEVRTAEVGVTRAQLTLQREEASPIPNVTLSAGYQRNFTDRENQAMYQVGIPLPLWNRNQGNIRAAQAELGRAVHDVTRARNDLVNRLAAAFGQYSVAQQRAERYRASILPNARKAYRLSLDAFKGAQFEYLRVLQSQRAVAEANLEYIRALSEAWRAASEIAGLLLEERWPCPPSGELPS